MVLSAEAFQVIVIQTGEERVFNRENGMGGRLLKNKAVENCKDVSFL